MRCNATISPRGRVHITNYEQSTYPVRCLGKDEEEKEMTSFSSSSFDAATTTTAKDMAPADAVEARAKDGFKEEAADGIPGADGLFDAQRMEEVEYVGGSSQSNHSTNFNHGHRQVKVNRTFKIDLQLDC